MRKTQCRMACGGSGAAPTLSPTAGVDRPEPGKCGGTVGIKYKKVGMAALTAGAAAESTLCWPWRQCSAHRLAASGSSWSQPGAMPTANLCAEHCHQGQQSADTAASPAVSAAIPTLLYLIPTELQHLPGSGRSTPAVDDSVGAAPEPPHAILHCVLRT